MGPLRASQIGTIGALGAVASCHLGPPPSTVQLKWVQGMSIWYDRSLGATSQRDWGPDTSCPRAHGGLKLGFIENPLWLFYTWFQLKIQTIYNNLSILFYDIYNIKIDIVKEIQKVFKLSQLSTRGHMWKPIYDTVWVVVVVRELSQWLKWQHRHIEVNLWLCWWS